MTRKKLIESMEWSKQNPPGSTCRYDHIISGDYRIEWKSWKKSPFFCIYWREDYVGAADSLDQAKVDAANHRIGLALAILPIPGLLEVINGEAVIVSVEPTDALLKSMAIRSDHGLGVPGYYDQPGIRESLGPHDKRLAATLITMRQLHEEVVGKGFWRKE